MTDLDVLVPNGLLGGSSTTLLATERDDEPNENGDEDMARDDAYVTRSMAENASNTATVDRISAVGFGENLLLGDTLVSNGLLGLGSCANDRAVDIESLQMNSTQSSGRDDDGFGVPTLLGASSTIDTSLSQESSPGPPMQPSVFAQSESQEDDFPEIRDILKPYARVQASASAVEESMPSVSAHLSRISLRATNFDGKSVLIRRKPRKLTSTLSNYSTQRNKMSNLLDIPIHRLMDELSLNMAAKLTNEYARAPERASETHTEDIQSTLWVDRYRPRRFADLLGDDRVHREVMAWVKEWDFCVFGPAKVRGKKRARDDDNPDTYRRPKERILLLSGPPGLGKTTLAHVVAKQAGYTVFEVNASDARSAQVVDERIVPALEAGMHIKTKKPYLIVIDEIDGATGGSDGSGGFIQRLVQVTMDKPKRHARKGQPQGDRPLLRPIICICNDLYASSLTKLRPHARIIRLNRPNDFHLVKRLRDICETENLRADSRALSALVGVAQGDLRGCLNTLQLIKARNELVTEPVVRNATIGMKETDVSQTAVLNDLFVPITRKRAKEYGLNEEEEARYIARLAREIESNGQYDRTAVGCFEHYATLRRHDANFSRYLQANEWLSMFDLMNGEMRNEREYTILQYLPYTLVPFYPLFQERGAPKVERPKADWENFTQTKVNEEIYKSLAKCLRTAGTRYGGAYRHLASDEILQLELAPMLNRIISPPLRPINSQVIRPDERAVLKRLVDIMVSLEFRFMQEKGEDGQLVYRLEPPIDVFVTYDGKRSADLSASRYAMRHLVAAEIDAKLTNRQLETVEKSKRSMQNFLRGKRPMDEAEDVEALDGASGDGELMAGQSASTVIKSIRRDTLEDKAPKDFFGRPIVAKMGCKKPVSGIKAQIKRPAVIYKFNEGNSAAVRKPVKVSAFL